MNVNAQDNFFYGLTVGSMLGILGIVVVVSLSFIKHSPPELIGVTRSELIEMKNECEKDLPRSKECSIILTYKPSEE